MAIGCSGCILSGALSVKRFGPMFDINVLEYGDRNGLCWYDYYDRFSLSPGIRGCEWMIICIQFVCLLTFATNSAIAASIHGTHASVPFIRGNSGLNHTARHDRGILHGQHGAIRRAAGGSCTLALIEAMSK